MVTQKISKNTDTQRLLNHYLDMFEPSEIRCPYCMNFKMDFHNLPLKCECELHLETLKEVIEIADAIHPGWYFKIDKGKDYHENQHFKFLSDVQESIRRYERIRYENRQSQRL